MQCFHFHSFLPNPLIPLKFMASLFIIIACLYVFEHTHTHTHLHTQTHIHIPNSNQFCQYNITCVCFLRWMPNKYALLWREIPLPLPVFLSSLSFPATYLAYTVLSALFSVHWLGFSEYIQKSHCVLCENVVHTSFV